MKMEKIKFTPEGEDEAIEFFVVEQTKIAGRDYLLVTEEEDGDSDAYILKDMSQDGESEAIYEFVDSEEELEAVSDVFSKMLEDIDLV